jgi:ribonuclease HI
MTDDGENLPHIHLFTDGACSGNPGPGGWGYILRHLATGKEKEASGGEADTTNNRMELQATIEGLSALKRRCYVELFTDSEYVRKGLQEWMAGWKRNGWIKSSDKKPVKNADLWKQLDELIQQHKLKFHHVDGHSGHPENERCDVLAVEASWKFR